MKFPGFLLRLLALPCLLAPWAAASHRPPPVLHVRSYFSPQRLYALEVDPSEPYGRGPARYRMTRGGREVWAAELPFTLYEAAVSDAGEAAGYAYSHDVQGSPLKRGARAGAGDLRVVIIDPAGKLRLNQAVKREHSGILHGDPELTASGLLLNSHSNRFFLRLGARWWVYELSTGKRLADLEVKPAADQPHARSIVAAQAVAGTPLMIVHWWRYGGQEVGALFTLVDAAGRQVWALDRPADYENAGDEDGENRLQHMVREKGAILAANEPGRFELWFASDGQRVLHAVGPAGDGWRVTETARSEYTLPRDEPALPALEMQPLEVLGSFVLEDAAPVGPIRDIDSFAFDDRGRIGFLRGEARYACTFVLADESGVAVSEIPLPPASARRGAHAAWVEGDRWIVTGTGPERDAKTHAWWLDAAKATLEEIGGLDLARVKALAGTGDGGFAALATRDFPSSMVDELTAFDREGKQRWKMEEQSSLDPASLFSPEDITLTTRGELAVVANIRETVQIFDRAGAHLRTIDLRKAWKREPNYPSDITPDADGGFIVHDFDGEPPFVRMTASGTVRASLKPRHADGRAVDPTGGLRAAPDGHLWCSDEHALLRLGRDGRVMQVLGAPPDDARLGVIASATCDQRGFLYAVDERTGAVHVFDDTGRKRRVCQPAKSDFSGNARWVDAGDVEAVTLRDGSVLLLTEKGYRRFNPDGTRGGIQRFGVDEIRETLVAQVPGGHFLMLAYKAAFLVTAEGKVTHKIERSADRRWLDWPNAAAAAPDGSFAILAAASHGYDRDKTLNFYAADAKPLRTVPLPPQLHGLAGFNGTHAVLQGNGFSFLYDQSGTSVRKIPAPAENEAWAQCLTRGGRELWLIEFASRKVTRYAMP